MISSASRLEAIAARLETIANRLDVHHVPFELFFFVTIRDEDRPVHQEGRVGVANRSHVRSRGQPESHTDLVNICGYSCAYVHWRISINHNESIN